jgi:hypothetical protein
VSSTRIIRIRVKDFRCHGLRDFGEVVRAIRQELCDFAQARLRLAPIAVQDPYRRAT